MTDRCKSCEYAHPIQQQPAVECRRYPPTVMLLPAQRTIANPDAPGFTLSPVFPTLHEDVLCGEFKLKVMS